MGFLVFSFQKPKTSVGVGGRKAEPPSAGGCSVGLKTAAAGGGGFGWKCDRRNDGL